MMKESNVLGTYAFLTSRKRCIAFARRITRTRRAAGLRGDQSANAERGGRTCASTVPSHATKSVGKRGSIRESGLKVGILDPSRNKFLSIPKDLPALRTWKSLSCPSTNYVMWVTKSAT